MIQPEPVPVYALHERLPHRPRPSVVRRMVNRLSAPLMGVSVVLVLIALYSLDHAPRTNLPALALLLIGGCLLFAAGLRVAPGEVSEYVEIGKVEWFE